MDLLNSFCVDDQKSPPDSVYKIFHNLLKRANLNASLCNVYADLIFALRDSNSTRLLGILIDSADSSAFARMAIFDFKLLEDIFE